MGGKSAAQMPTDPSGVQNYNTMRQLTQQWVTDLGPGFWGAQGMPQFGTGTPSTSVPAAGTVSMPSGGDQAAAPSAAAPAAAIAGGTDMADPAAPSGGSATTTPDSSSAGSTLASSVAAAPSYWTNQGGSKTKGSAVTTQT